MGWTAALGRRVPFPEATHEYRAHVLLGLRLRAAGPQFDGQTPRNLQAEDRVAPPHPVRRRAVRVRRGRRAAVLEAPDPRVPRRGRPRVRRRNAAEEEVTGVY